MSTENDIQREILARLAKIPGIVCWRQNTGASKKPGGRYVRFGLPGQGDITGILPGGRRFELEVKTATGKLSPEQVAFGERVNAAGGLWACVRSVEEAVDVIERAILRSGMTLEVG